jgi:uncharacterized membrane protein
MGIAPLVALVPAVALLLLGFPWVVLVVVLEAAGLAAAVVLYALHARDGEDVLLADGRLQITFVDGASTSVGAWPASQVKVLSSPPEGLDLQVARDLILRVGRSVHVTARNEFARQLAQTLAESRLSAVRLPPPRHVYAGDEMAAVLADLRQVRLAMTPDARPRQAP